jgi:hypothetical protein
MTGLLTHLYIEPSDFFKIIQTKWLLTNLPAYFTFLLLFVVFALAFRPEIAINNLHLALAIKKSYFNGYSAHVHCLF